MGADGYEMSKIFVERLPIIKTQKIDSKMLKDIETLAQEILESKACHTKTPACHPELEHNESEVPRHCEALQKQKWTHEVLTNTCKSTRKNNADFIDCHKATASRDDKNTQDLESKLDSMIYQIYGLKQDEINIIESELQSKERE